MAIDPIAELMGAETLAPLIIVEAAGSELDGTRGDGDGEGAGAGGAGGGGGGGDVIVTLCVMLALLEMPSLI